MAGAGPAREEMCGPVQDPVVALTTRGKTLHRSLCEPGQWVCVSKCLVGTARGLSKAALTAQDQR